MRIWFPEPLEADDSAARQDEEFTTYLARSTCLRARETRRFLNENISMLPSEAQAVLHRAFRNRYKSALFELILGRTLQTLGAEIQVEPEQPDGRRPDFQAIFPDATVIVEAVSPNFDSCFGDDFKARKPLRDIIERYVPDGWSIIIAQLPWIGPNDSKREFVGKVKSMFTIAPPAADCSELDLHQELSTGVIHLHLRPRRQNWPAIICESSAAHFSSFDEGLRNILHKKSKQLRGVEYPTLLAVEYTWEGELKDFNSTLYGFESQSPNPSGEAKDSPSHSGWFFRKADVMPRIAGVLAYRVGFSSASGPVLYRHPGFTGQLPSAFLKIEQRLYVAGSGVQYRAASSSWGTELSQTLRCVKD